MHMGPLGKPLDAEAEKLPHLERRQSAPALTAAGDRRVSRNYVKHVPTHDSPKARGVAVTLQPLNIESWTDKAGPRGNRYIMSN